MRDYNEGYFIEDPVWRIHFVANLKGISGSLLTQYEVCIQAKYYEEAKRELYNDYDNVYIINVEEE